MMKSVNSSTGAVWNLKLHQNRVKADTVAAPDAIELPRDRRGDELMMEVERFVKLCKSLYPSRGMES